MNLLDYYRNFVRSMWISPPDRTVGMDIAIAQLGIAGEAGEVSELIKKHLRGDGPLDTTKLTKELGDLVYYIVKVGDLYGITLDEIIQGNIDKLSARLAKHGTLRGSGSDR